MGFVAISILDVLYVKRVEKKQNGVCVFAMKMQWSKLNA